eukprot:2560573-Rhodomonas_salina.2
MSEEEGDGPGRSRARERRSSLSRVRSTLLGRAVRFGAVLSTLLGTTVHLWAALGHHFGRVLRGCSATAAAAADLCLVTPA